MLSFCDHLRTRLPNVWCASKRAAPAARCPACRSRTTSDGPAEATFEGIAPYIRDTVTLTGDGEPDQVIAVRSLGLFPVLGIPARLGRTLIASDDDEGPRNVAVLSDRLWRRRYHADPGVIGRGITISNESYTIVGVMPRDFAFRYSEADLWASLRLTPTSPRLQIAAPLRAAVRACDG